MGLEVKLAFVSDFLVILQNIIMKYEIEFHTCLNFQMDKLVCGVCGGKSPTGLHYGATTCYPCRAFFRFLFLNLYQIFYLHSITRTKSLGPQSIFKLNHGATTFQSYEAFFWALSILMTILLH